MDEVIRTEGLTKTYGDRTVVDRVDLSLQPGEIYGFLGPNGAGKTTTLRMILGLIPPTSGTVSVLGQPIGQNPGPQRAQIGVVGERDSFSGDETAGEHLRFFAQLHGMQDYEERIQELLEHFALIDFIDLLASRFSQGMKRKLSLARALLSRPEILILDEPAMGLDPHGIRQVREILVQEREKGCAVLVSSHILSEVERTADRVGIIDHGRLLLEETVETVRGHLMQDSVLEVELQSYPQGLVEALQAAAGVLGVQRETNRLLVHTQAGNDVRADISQHVAEHGGLVIGMQWQEGSLEDAFVRITTESISRLDMQMGRLKEEEGGSRL